MVNGINGTNPYIYTGNTGKVKENKSTESNDQGQINTQVDQKSLSDKQIFAALEYNNPVINKQDDSAAATAKKETRVIPVSNYVNAEDAKNISNSIKFFENTVGTMATTAKEEHPELSDSAANLVGVLSFSNEYMPA